MNHLIPRSRSTPEILVLVLISAGFAAALLTYRTFFPDNFGFLTSDEISLGFLSSVLTFWLGARLADSTQHAWLRAFDEFRIGTGLNLLIQAVLNYFDLLTRSMFLIAVGGLFATLLLAAARRFLLRRREMDAGTLIVGWDVIALDLARDLGDPILGIVGSPERCPREIPYLGDFEQFESIVAQRQPKNILIARDAETHVPGSALLDQRKHGANVALTADLYEAIEQRVFCRGWKPINPLLSHVLAGTSRAMALQAVYNNLIGLTLVMAASPVIALAAVWIALFGGSGPVIESTECAGFQKIPFRRLRFRTHDRTTGRLTPAGRLVSRLRLTRLPLLFNIVRGEMALFGPRPVRCDFASRLIEIVPYYSLRFAVKPGIICWSAVQSGCGDNGSLDVLSELEYELYYVEHGSPPLDFEILMRLIFERPRAEEKHSEDSPAQLAPPVR